MGCDCEGLRRKIAWLEQQLDRHEAEGSREDEDYDEDDLDDEDMYDLSDISDRFDEPPRIDPSDPRRSAGRHGAGSGHVANPGKAMLRYAHAVASGDVFGGDIARFAAGETFRPERSPIDKGRAAVSRFRRWG
jgi:hypothetical protein